MHMENAYGLGFVLALEDNASDGFRNMWGTFDETTTRAENMTNSVGNSFQKFEALTVSGLGLKQTGDSFIHGSKAVLGNIKQIGTEVIKTGNNFEQSRKTLEALYKSPDIAKQKMNWAMSLAAKTPFDINDVKSALIGLKSAGVDADKTFVSTNGTMRTFLEYVGDLAGLRPDVGMEGVMMGVRNAIGGDGGKSLRARMDIDPASIIGHKLEGTSEQIMKDIVEMSQKSANNLMQKLDGTWTQLTSNLEDQKTRFMLAISDAGAFDAVKKTLVYISDAVESIDDTKLKNLGKALGDAFSVVWKPIDFVAKKIVDLVMGIEKLVETHPKIARLVLVFLSLTGAILGATGIFFKFAGGIMMAVGSMGTFILMAKHMGATGGIFAGLGTAIRGLVTSMLPLALAVGGVYLAWRTNFMGIRDIMQSFVNNCHTAFSYSAEVAGMSFNQMAMEVDELEERFSNGDIFAGITLGLIKLRVIWACLVDAWSDNTLSDENFKKAQLLGVLPLIEAILNLKANFEAFIKGFAKGWSEVNQKIAEVGKLVGDIVGKVAVKLFEIMGIKDKMIKKINNIKEAIMGVKPDTWNRIGEILGKVTAILLTTVGGFRLFKKVLSLVALPFIKLFTIGTQVYGMLGKVSVLLATNPFAFWGVLIVGLIAGFIALYTKCETFRNIVNAVGRTILEVARGILIGIIGIVGSIVTTVMGLVTAIFTIVSGIGIVVYTAIMSIVGIIASAGAVVYGAVYTIVAGIIALFYSVSQIAYGIFASIGAFIASAFAIAFGAVATVLHVFLGVVQTIFAVFKAIVQTVVAVVVAIFTGNFSSLGSTLKQIWGSVGDRVKQIWENVCSRVKGVWQGVGSYLSGAWNSLKSIWSGVMNNISSFASSAVNKVKGCWSGIGGFFKGVWSGITGSARSMFDWLAGKFAWLSNIIDKTKSAFNKVSGAVTGGGGGAPAPSHHQRMIGLSTGGYVKTTGMAVLHPNEVVVNDETTQMLRDFLITSRGGQQNYAPMNSSSSNTTSVDNSVTFEKGSIIIESAEGSNAVKLSDDLIKAIEQKLKRRQQINNMMQYKPI